MPTISTSRSDRWHPSCRVPGFRRGVFLARSFHCLPAILQRHQAFKKLAWTGKSFHAINDAKGGGRGIHTMDVISGKSGDLSLGQHPQ